MDSDINDGNRVNFEDFQVGSYFFGYWLSAITFLIVGLVLGQVCPRRRISRHLDYVNPSEEDLNYSDNNVQSTTQDLAVLPA